MTDGVSFKIDGLEEVLAKFKGISDDLEYKGGRFALRKASQVVRDAAKVNAARVDDPQSPDRIADNVVERWSGRTFKATKDLKFRVGVLGGSGGDLKQRVEAGEGGDTRHWRLVELGTEKQAARPFMRPALSQNTQEAISTFVREYDKALGRALKRSKR